MDFNHNVRFKTVYPHSHISIYNAPIISNSMPSITLAPGLNLVSTTARDSTQPNHEGTHFSALATLQVSSASSLSLPATAQLVPLNTLDSLQLQQMHQHTYIDQANQITKPGNQFLQVQIANPIPTVAQDSSVTMSLSRAQTPNNAGQDVAISNKKSIINLDNEMKSEANSNSGEPSNVPPAAQQEKKSSNQNNNNVKYNSSGENYMHNFSNKYAIINSGKGFRCLVCSREFTQKGNLKTHALTHLGPTERPYDCETCGRRFTQKGNRDIHVKIHTGTKDHTCPYCDRGFTQRGNLKTHIRSVHTGEKPYSCGHCGKAFSQKANMLTHFRTHDKNSRFSCNVCGKTFSQKASIIHDPFDQF